MGSNFLKELTTLTPTQFTWINFTKVWIAAIKNMQAIIHPQKKGTL